MARRRSKKRKPGRLPEWLDKSTVSLLVALAAFGLTAYQQVRPPTPDPIIERRADSYLAYSQWLVDLGDHLDRQVAFWPRECPATGDSQVVLEEATARYIQWTIDHGLQYPQHLLDAIFQVSDARVGQLADDTFHLAERFDGTVRNGTNALIGRLPCSYFDEILDEDLLDPVRQEFYATLTEYQGAIRLVPGEPYQP